MAIYHLNVKIISRSKGQSAVASAAYRSATKLVDKEVGKTCDYTRKSGVVYSEISLCKNAPKGYQDRETLWNAVHDVEKSSNSQLAREVEVALPREFSRQEQIEVVQEYIQKNFVAQGMCADWSLHDKGDGNPHAHIMLTTRPIEPNGKWGSKERKGYALDEHGERIPLIDETTGKQKVDKRNRKQWKRAYVQTNDWNNPENAERWRQSWADVCNSRLSKDNQIDHRSFKRRGIEIEPTIHEGYTARKMERMGDLSDRCQINRDIKLRNTDYMAVSNELKDHIQAESSLSLMDKLLDSRDEYYRQAVALDMLKRTHNVYEFRVTPKAMKQAIVNLPKKVSALRKIDKQLEEYSTQKFGGLVNTLFHGSEKSSLEQKRSKALKECKKTFKVFTDGGAIAYSGGKAMNPSKLSNTEVRELIASANKTALPKLEYWEMFHQLTDGVSPESKQMALEHLKETYKAMPQADVGTAVGLLESEPIPVYSFNEKLNIPLNVYSSIENDVNTALDTTIKPIKPTGTKHFYSLDDMSSYEYAPKSTHTHEHEEQLKKNKDVSR